MKFIPLLSLAALAALALSACTASEDEGAVFAFDTRVSLAANDPYGDNDPRSMRMQYGGIGEVYFEYAFGPHLGPDGDTLEALRLIPTSEQGDYETEYALLLPNGRAYFQGPNPGWHKGCEVRDVRVLAVDDDREITANATARQETHTSTICNGAGCVSTDELRLRFEVKLDTDAQKEETKGQMPWGSGTLRCGD